MATTGLASAEGVLQLYNWGNYTSPELLEKFKAETGITVTVTDYDSNDVALAKIEAGGHGFDLVVPSANYVQIFADKGLTVPLGSVAPAEPRQHRAGMEGCRLGSGPHQNSIPWQWGTVGVAVDTAVYSGDINTSAVWLEVPDELKGKINVVPEMTDIVSLATMYYGGEPCSEDLEVLKKVRDGLLAAKPNWISMDYGATEKMSNKDWAASVNWNGSSMRVRQNVPTWPMAIPRKATRCGWTA
jgi:spermidine/putrescine transport system substrate-binding protein